MARTPIAGYGARTPNTRMKSAVIWVRGFALDDGTEAARVDAAQRGCISVDLKNENMYDQIPDPVQDYDFCYTDDPQIAEDYTRAGITVVELEPRVSLVVDNDDADEPEPAVKAGARKRITLNENRSAAA